MEYLFNIHPNHGDVRGLCKDDPLLNELINRIGHIRVPVQPDGFTYLARTLIGQQLSVKAAGTIFQRIERLCGGITPDSFLAAGEESLRSAGLSKNKLGYIRNAAEQTKEGVLNFQAFADMEDEEVVRLLTSVKGIGRWTAEMFLIFYLGRRDVISFGDRGLNRAAEWLYASENSSGSSPLHRKHLNWKPYNTLVSLYLWEAINVGLVQAGPFISQFEENNA